MSDSQKSVYLIDASIYIFRAWFSVPDSMRGEDGTPVNAIYGFCRFLTEFVERTKASHVGIAFDESLTSSFRNELYPAYKMNRELPPEDLSRQFKMCKRIAIAAGLHCVAHDQYEADDLIATMAVGMRDRGFNNIIVSGDKDLTQIIRGKEIWWDFARDNQLDINGVEEKFGVPATAIQDYLGLCGDAVDNIPGVPGIGPKTASSLLQEFGTVENLYEGLGRVSQLKIRGAKTLADKLRTHQQQAFLSKELATVAYNAPIEVNDLLLKRKAAEIASLQEISQIIGGRGDGLFQRLVSAAQSVS